MGEKRLILSEARSEYNSPERSHNAEECPEAGQISEGCPAEGWEESILTILLF